MLLPALEKAKVSANKASCTNNLKQIGNAVGLYMADQDGYFTPDQGRWGWSFYVAEMLNKLPKNNTSWNSTADWKDRMKDWAMPVNDIFACPIAVTTAQNHQLLSSGTISSNAPKAATNYTALHANGDENGVVATTSTDRRGGWGIVRNWNTNSQEVVFPRKASHISSSSVVMMCMAYADCHAGNCYALGSTARLGSQCNWSSGNLSQAVRIKFSRFHGGTINVMRADLSVSGVSGSAVWNNSNFCFE